MTVILEEPIQAFLGNAEERGSIEETALEALATEHELEEEDVAALRAELELARSRSSFPRTRSRLGGRRAPGTADALTLFMNRAGRYALLTAAEEVALAKRIERGDPRRRSG